MMYYYKEIRADLVNRKHSVHCGISSIKPAYGKAETDGGYTLTLVASKEEVKAYWKQSKRHMMDFCSFKGIRQLDRNVYFGDFLSVVHCLQPNRSQRKHIEAIEKLARANTMRIAY